MNKKINFISNIQLSELSGGGSSVNFATFEQLSKYFDVNFIGPIKPKQDYLSKASSKMKRLLSLKGNYHYYSNKRLQQIASEIDKHLFDIDGSVNFFHSITPWIDYQGKNPYYAYTDACFATYVSVFNNRSLFSETDLKRIFQKEALWISRAKKIFFRSQWALEETVKHYNISPDNLEVVGLGGFIPIPEKDNFSGEKSFLFISKEFGPKGGKICIEAFKRLSSKYEDVTLKIVGAAPPPSDIEGHKNIVYMGFLNKEDSSQFAILQNELSRAFALIHPTNKDTNALVITEAGYYGCPSIASNSFAIPEFIKNNQTGLLLNVPLLVDELVEKMKFLLDNPEQYRMMRKNVREFTTKQNTWDKVGERLATSINL